MNNYMPKDIYQYIKEQGIEIDFLSALVRHVQGYTIGEITDRAFVQDGGQWKLQSGTYQLDVTITDDEIVTALCNQIYVSAFLSRNGDTYQIHFLVHQYPSSMKPRFEEEITQEVVHYMIMKTILALRLDTPEKVQGYLKG